MPLSVGEQNLLRFSHPHAALKYLSVYVPVVIFCGTVTDSPDRGANVFDVVEVSSVSTPQPGMEVRVGTSCGDGSISIRRLRDKTGDTITVDENGVEWEDGQFISIVNFRPLFPKYPFISDTPPYEFFKDLDIPYTDQNEFPQPVAIIDVIEPQILDGPSVVFNLDASRSYAIAQGASITNYLWSSTTGTIASDTSAATTLTVTSPGQLTITLTVTDSNGKTQFQDRYTFVHQRFSGYQPYTDFDLVSPPSGNWQASGYTANVSVFGNADITEFPDGAYVVIWTEQWFDGQKTSIGDSGNILMAGYIRKDTVTKNIDTGDVTFDITTMQGILDRHMMFSVSLTDNDSPDTWYKYKDLTVARAIHHLWNEHSTLFNICNVLLPMSNTLRLSAVDDFVNGTLLSLPDGFAHQHGIFAHVCCNKLNDVYVEEELNMLSDADRAAVPTVMTITDIDRRGEQDVQIVRNTEKRIALTMLSGTSYDGSTSTPLISKFPGEVPEAIGSGIVNLERQVLASQAQSNELVGRAHAIANNPILEERVALAGNYYGALDLVPQQWFNQELPASSNKRGIDLTGVKMVPRLIDIEVQGDAILPRVVFELDATGYDGIPGNYPTSPPDDPPAPTPAPVFPVNLVAFNDAGSCHVRSLASVQNWVLRDGTLTGSDVQDLHGDEDPWWFTTSKKNTNDPSEAILIKTNDGKIFRTANQGVDWSDVTPTDNPPNGADDSPAPDPGDLAYIQYDGDWININTHYALANQAVDGGWRSWIYFTDDDFATDNWLQLPEIVP